MCLSLMVCNGIVSRELHSGISLRMISLDNRTPAVTLSCFTVRRNNAERNRESPGLTKIIFNQLEDL